MSITIKKRSSSKKHEGGCYVSCCVGITIVIAALFLLGLIVLLVFFTYPTKSCPRCPQITNRSGFISAVSNGSPGMMSENEIWQQCGTIAKKKNVCLTDCSDQRPPFGPGGDLPEVPKRVRLTDIRLNRTLTPLTYNIELQPWIYNVTNARIDGMEEIVMTCKESTDVIVLHANNITVDETSIELRENNANGQRIQVVTFEVDTPRQFIKFFPQSRLRAGRNYYLKMKFVGTLLNKMKGFYRAMYTYQGLPRYLGVTQFEEADARRAFPCFDEPSFKAEFVITLVRKPDYVALSNMPLDRTQIRDGGRWVADTFRKTPVMSSYIIAMFVGQYVKKERTTPKGTLVRVWTQPNYIDYAEFALSITGEIIEAFEEWTGIKYPLEKTDQVAVTEFAAGAMENWGLIVYKDPTLLYNPSYSTMEGKRLVADVIAHELAHQWFGNLVTMAWWDDTFLNEGFATYMGFHVGVDSVRKDWNMDTFFMRQTQNIMKQDTSAKSQPIILDGIEQYYELHDAFSLITYNKGAAIIRMIKYFLGEDTFKKAIQNYLKSHSYGNAVLEDLVYAFNQQAIADGRVTWDQSKVNLTMIIDSWVRQQNYPLVEVTDLKGGLISVSQSRFVDDTMATPKHPPPTGEFLWHIPFTYGDAKTLDRGGYILNWVNDFDTTIDTKTNGWKLANVFAQGFYRVLYDAETWKAILGQLKTDHTLIPVESRAEIIDDAFALANEGKFSEVYALAATEYLVNETEYLPWYPALKGRIIEYEKLLRRTPTYSALNNYMLKLVIPNYERLGWNNADSSEHMDKYLRILMIKEACSRKYQPCVLEALKQFQQYVDNMKRSITSHLSEAVNPISPDLREIVYCTAVAHGGPDVWENMLSIFLSVFKNVDYTANELSQVVLGLTCVDDAVSIQTMLGWALQFNLSGVIDIVAARPNTISTVWDYLDREWDNIPRGIYKVNLLWIMTDYFASESDLKKLTSFIENHPDISSRESKLMVDKVKANKEWVDQNEAAISDWLRTRSLDQHNARKRRSLYKKLKDRMSWQKEWKSKSGNDRFKYQKQGLDLGANKFQFQVKDSRLTVEVDTSFDSAPIF